MNKKFIALGITLVFLVVGFSGCIDLPDIPDEIIKDMNIISFNVTPSIINSGQTANLSWTVTGSKTTVEINQGIGTVSLIGYRIIQPTATTTYVITVTNETKTLNATTQIIVINNSNDTDADDDNPIAIIETSKGNIRIELFQDKAPKTVENFVKLVNDGFYDGMIFHRVMDNFMIQAGNTYPDGTTKNSPYGNIVFESDPDLTHEDGAISMASTGAGVGGSAQFFICDGAQHGLDGSYAVFGKTISGIEVVRDIADELHDSSYGSVGGGKPIEDIIIHSISIS